MPLCNGRMADYALTGGFHFLPPTGQCDRRTLRRPFYKKRPRQPPRTFVLFVKTDQSANQFSAKFCSSFATSARVAVAFGAK